MSQTPKIPFDVIVAHVVPYVRDDDATAFRKTCTALYRGVYDVYVYSNRRYQFRYGTVTLPVKTRHADVLNIDEIVWIDRIYIETLVVHVATAMQIDMWFNNRFVVWPVLHTLDIRFDPDYKCKAGVTLNISSESLPAFDTLCVSNKSFVLNFDKPLNRLRVRYTNRVDVSRLPGLNTLHLSKLCKVMTPDTIDTLYMGTRASCPFTSTGTPIRTRHLVLAECDTCAVYIPRIAHDCIRELSILKSSQCVLFEGKREYDEIDLVDFPDLEIVNVAFPCRIVNAPDACRVNRIQLDEKADFEKRFTVPLL